MEMVTHDEIASCLKPAVLFADLFIDIRPRKCSTDQNRFAGCLRYYGSLHRSILRGAVDEFVENGPIGDR